MPLHPPRFAHVAIALAALLAGCETRPAPHEEPLPQIPTARAVAGRLRPAQTLGGFVAPYANVAVTSSLNEPALAVHVTEGEAVRRGTVLAVLDVSDLRAQYDAETHAANEAEANAARQLYEGIRGAGAAESGVATAAAALEQARERERLDRLTLRRDATLLAQGYLAQQVFDTQEQTVRNDEAAVRSAQAALANARTTLATNGGRTSGAEGAALAAAREAASSQRASARRTAAQIARATIVSPIDGVVTNRNLNVGEFPGARTLFTVQSVDAMYASLGASAEQLAGIRLGDAARIGVAGGGRAYVGRVTAILGQTVPGATNFNVQVAIRRPAGVLAGTPVTATIERDAVDGIVVPRSALSADGRFVAVVRDGRYRRVSVRVLAVQGDRAAVAGIVAGTAVALDGATATDVTPIASR